MDKIVVENRDLLDSAIEGLTAIPKSLESKWFYDHAGSTLFEAITELPEYYPTRTELSILRDQIAALAKYAPTGAALVELGAGASTKTRLLLDELHNLGAYVPLDISAEFLHQSAAALAADYPRLTVSPVVADFMAPVRLPDTLNDVTKVAFFPGSTIGNLAAEDAINLLSGVRRWKHIEAFIIGIDLIKDEQTLVQAYDDAAGITAQFNLNLLRRLNREVGADFDIDAFAHEARWNEQDARIEMHLVSQKAQQVQLGQHLIDFGPSESIHTENSRKYSRESFAQIADQSGWVLDTFLTDPDGLFAVTVLVPK